MNLFDVFLHSQALEGITLSMMQIECKRFDIISFVSLKKRAMRKMMVHTSRGMDEQSNITNVSQPSSSLMLSCYAYIEANLMVSNERDRFGGIDRGELQRRTRESSDTMMQPQDDVGESRDGRRWMTRRGAAQTRGDGGVVIADSKPSS
ncbi:hypothetical protein Syun_026181 [Stephania yunnanensis]|uniref:Uncharacterized protein n=1 Tax=Stephania yunnanensis TaxID=152371 RepID=A0AAP0HWG4_9MAGN